MAVCMKLVITLTGDFQILSDSVAFLILLSVTKQRQFKVKVT